MPNYNYTHGSTTNRNRLRFLLGDHRGTNGTVGTDWLFSDEELDDLLLSTMYNSDIHAAARFALQCRINREAFLAGVSGTTDTTDRPAALVNALRMLERLVIPLSGASSAALPDSEITSNEDLDETTDMGDET